MVVEITSSPGSQLIEYVPRLMPWVVLWVSATSPDPAPTRRAAGLAGPGVRFGLTGIECGALKVGRAGAEVVGGAHGFYYVHGGRTAAAGVEVDVVVVGERRER